LVELAGLLVFGFASAWRSRMRWFPAPAAFGTLRTGHRRHHVAEVEFERVGEDRIGGRRFAPHALRLRIGFDQLDALGLAAGHGEVVDGFAVDREEAAGRAVFRAHIADGGAVGERHRIEAGAVELDELADNALLAQHLHDGQHQVGGGDAFLESCRSGGSR
jgi:hypothetical protein